MKYDKKYFFKRQITLSEIGELGQQKLQDAKVLVVGCGGLGSPILKQRDDSHVPASLHPDGGSGTGFRNTL